MTSAPPVDLAGLIGRVEALTDAQRVVASEMTGGGWHDAASIAEAFGITTISRGGIGTVLSRLQQNGLAEFRAGGFYRLIPGVPDLLAKAHLRALQAQAQGER